VQFWCNSAHGRYATGRNEDTGRAATWAAWGYVIAELYCLDPNAHIGHYRSRHHFITAVYQAQRAFIRRQQLGIRNRFDQAGGNCHFLSLFSDEELDSGYAAMNVSMF